jgi:hypothetical protein
MNATSRLISGWLVAAFAVGAISTASSLPAAAAAIRSACASNHNIMHVHRRLDGAIDQLQHDQRDYGGHREHAIDDLQQARGQLVAAEEYAQNTDRDNPRCFRVSGSTGGSDVNWGLRNQPASNGNLLHVRAWVEQMIDQLQRDERDYGGHREQAIDAMQAARNQLLAAEQYSQARRR